MENARRDRSLSCLSTRKHMKIEQIYTGCLSHAAYYIENNGEAAIFDPLRDVQPYLDRAKKDNAKIKYIFETHFHADFVSGHIDLAKKTGGNIVFGPTAKPQYNAIIGTDGQEFKIGNYTIKLIHTPGHTMESCVYLLIDENGNKHGIITGDTLFIGDVGRPDLAQHVVSELTQEKLAGLLFDSLRTKIMPLEDHLIIYPNHGAGSACGKNMSKETQDTLGHQKQVNYALNPSLSKEEFISTILTGLTPPPGYFPQNVLMNIKGYESLDEILMRSSKALNIRDFEALEIQLNAVIIDSRSPAAFCKGSIPGSINIGLDGSFASWAGTLFPDLKKPILLITDKQNEMETITRLTRVGFDNVVGYLDGGFDNWKYHARPVDTIRSIEAADLTEALKTQKGKILDIRRESEFESQHIVGAQNLPLDHVNENLDSLNKDTLYYVHCASGYRSVIFISILKALGYSKLINISDGFKGLKASGAFELSEFKQPVTML